MRKGPARRRDEQRRERERRGERAFVFGPDDRYLGEVEREEWEVAISAASGDVAEAARYAGLDVPRSARALWGRSKEEALGAYRRWRKPSRRR